MLKEDKRSSTLNPTVWGFSREFVGGGILTLISAVFCMWLCQFSCGFRLSEIMTLSAYILFVCIYAVIFGAVTVASGRLWLGNCVAMVFMFAVTMLDYQVYYFRGTEIAPGDLNSMKTALGVAGQYEPLITVPIVVGCILLLVYLFLMCRFTKFRKGLFWRGISVPVLAGAAIVSILFIDNVPLIAFGNEGMRLNTFPVNFCRLMQGSEMKEPEGYSSEVIRKLENTYQPEPDTWNRPVIIAIMNESFADFSRVGDIPVEEDILPFFHGIQENAVKGFAQVPTFGAGTANTEWEFLTGNSMHFLPTGATPYSNYAITNSFSSVVSHLSKIGYYCIAMHPYYEYGYTRNTVYPRMGFHEIQFLQDFPQKKLLREYVSDQEMYEEIIRQYETHTGEEPLFIFGVTMQNHGGYEYNGEHYEKTVTLQNMSRKYPKAEQYLSVLKQSDAALAYLIQYFQTVEEDVVIAFFGDHLPAIEQEFYEEIAQGKTDEQLQFELHSVPFFIWANYGINARIVDCTSVNYLTNYIYEVAQIPKSGYSSFLSQLQAHIPVISVDKVYSRSEEKFIGYSQLSGIEEELMRQYSYLVYNAVCDVNGRSVMFKSN